jgi:hypothetical protein
MMQHVNRSELMLFRSRSLSYGRRLISAEAIEELNCTKPPAQSSLLTRQLKTLKTC